MALVLTLGCSQPPPAPVWPWSYPTSAPAGAATPGATANNTAYMAELQRQAATQAQMAAEQQRRIQDMMALQQQTNDQLAAMKRQEEERKQAAALAATDRDKDLAEQARQALGRYGELGERAKELDRNNRDLYTQMAQIQQRSQLLEDQNYLLRQRLKETSDQLASAMQSSQVTEQRLQAVQASTVRRGGAAITANSSLKRNLTAVTVPGLNIRQDGEVVRIELPADQLFENGTATLRPGSEAQLDQVAQVVIEHYSRQVIGIEAHTDGLPPAGTSFRNPHQLTAAQAMAVFDHVGERHRTLAEQLFVLGHGANYPVASNATSAGQQRNRRVEIVIYPEPVGSR